MWLPGRRADKLTPKPTFRSGLQHGERRIVHELKSVLSPSEIQHIIDASKPLLQPSLVVDGSVTSVSTQRTSSSAFLKKSHDAVIRNIEDRFSKLAGIPRGHMEPLQVVKYGYKQEFKPHHDYFKNLAPGASQRVRSIFVYLKHVPDHCGGGTAFPHLNARFAPRSGDALMWSNLKDDNSLDDLTLHAGEPVLCADETKYGLNVWFRDKLVTD